LTQISDKGVEALWVYGWPRMVVVAAKVSQGRTLLKPVEHYASRYPFWDAVSWAVLAVDTPCSERQGYESVLEHVVVQFVARCSRICTHELVRHRLASYAQTSTRVLGLEAFRPDDRSVGSLYALVARAAKGDEYALRSLCVLPDLHRDEVMKACTEYFRRVVEAQGKGIDQGLRYAQPDALAAHILVTTNLREYLHMASLRLHPHAHWEIRRLFERTAQLLWQRHRVPVHLMLLLRRPGLARTRKDLVDKAQEQLRAIVENIEQVHAQKIEALVKSVIEKVYYGSMIGD